MEFCYFLVDDRKGQKPDVFVKFVEHSLNRSLLLKQTIITKEPGSMKARHHAGKFLYHCLLNRSFLVSEDKRTPVRHLLRRRHHGLKSPECLV